MVKVTEVPMESQANEPALALALSTYQPALSWSPPPPCAGRRLLCKRLWSGAVHDEAC